MEVDGVVGSVRSDDGVFLNLEVVECDCFHSPMKVNVNFYS
jgi:hypothetical protein